MSEPQFQSVEFTGSGSEYFCIWIANVFLSIVTLGIYSAWAKVRRNQYFYRNTVLAGATFDYHGEPKVILKGRIVAFVLFGAYSFFSNFNPEIALVILALILALMPWLLVKSLRFRLHNSSYRSLRFAFDGSVGQAYLYWLWLPLGSALTFGLLWPFAQQRMTRFARTNSRYGNARFELDVTVGAFYRIYAMVVLIALLIFVASSVAATLLVTGGGIPLDAHSPTPMVIGLVAAFMTYLGLFLIAYPYISARMQNLLWNHTRLREHRFHADVRARHLLVIIIANLFLTLLTLGLYKPYADVRLVRYRLQHIQLAAGGEWEQFVAGLQDHVSAAGDEMADMFDFDIAL